MTSFGRWISRHAVLTVVLMTTCAAAYGQESWHRIGLAGKNVRSIIQTPNGAICVTTDNGVFRSTDNGTTWSATAVTKPGGTIAVSGNTVVAAATDWLARSTDQGESWITTVIDPVNYGGYIRTVVADKSGRFFFGTVNHIWRSTDLGETWKSVRGNGLDLNYPDVSAYAFGGDGLMLAGTSGIEGGYVYGTIDGGDSWLQLSRPRGFTDIVALAVLSDDTYLASAAGQSKLIRSTNMGIDWVECTGGPDLTSGAVTSFAVIADAIYASSSKSGVLRSTDQGETWVTLNDGLGTALTFRGITALADGHPLLLTSDGIFQYSTVAGVEQVKAAERLDLK